MRPLFSVFNVLALVLLGLSALAYRMVQEPPAAPKAPQLLLAGQKNVQVTLYFSDSQVRRYVRQVRSVAVSQDDPVVLAQATLKGWVAGPEASGNTTNGSALAVVPRDSAVPTVMLRGEHFVVNLPGSYAALNYGVAGERMLLCSLTRTLLEQRGKDVMFLVSGKNADTLLGHADLHAPYAREDCADE
ncbi:GerMN domain-containing protein [Deinococcus altitudinis]|uniref:GerMN domain-containing protein n=1 Tax=Deinococcus altitudinis TaxID=468914 RepID=UPI00389160EA